ncbi:calmodulin-binding transcription activator 2-like isoform X2 [Littorina saxatilis]|uniref:calmodulin-binding transcription activator 2-like isoform X2 n=1 Tax=Littorina saxatilis TaxID=31220 RepID=UPI0038B531F0
MEGQTSGQPPPGSNQEDDEPPKLNLPEQLQKIVPATELPSNLTRWNTNEEIAAILIAFDRHKEWLLDKPRIRPASGSLLMYNRKKVMFRRDGYCWKKRRDGKTNREDHMKLKVKGVECIYGSYVHSAILPTFHRRCYWLLQNPHVVLVHYLNVPNPPNNPKMSLMPSLSGEMRNKEWSKEELVDQLRPMLASDRQGEMNPDQDQKVEETLEAIFQLLVSSQEEGAKPLSVDTGHQHPCRATAVAAASSLISRGNMAGLTSALTSPHPSSRPVVKQEMVRLQQAGGQCMSTMAHLHVTAHPHQHHQLQHNLPSATATSGAMGSMGEQQRSDLHLQSASSGLHHGQHIAVPTTTVSTSLSQLTLATFSHVHLSSPSPLQSVPVSVESQLAHLPNTSNNNATAHTVIPASVNLLTGLAGPDQFQGVALLQSGSVPVVSAHQSLSQSFPSLVDSGIFKAGDHSSSLGMSTASVNVSQAAASQPNLHSSGVVTLCPSGLVVKEAQGLGSVVAFASSPNVGHFSSVSQVAHTPSPSHHHHPHHHLPGPSKDIPLFAANPLTQCSVGGGDCAGGGCDQAAGCADHHGISGVGCVEVGGLADSGDNCDTLDGSFSSLPSTDLNLDLFLDLQDLEDCAADLAAATSLSPPHLPPSPPSPLGASSSHHPLATSSPLMSGGDPHGCHGSSHCGVPSGVSHQLVSDVLSGSYLNHSTTTTSNAQLSHRLPHTGHKHAFPSGGVWEGALSSTLTDHHPQDVIAQQLSGEVKVMDMGGYLHPQAQSGAKTNHSNASCTVTSCSAICDFSPEWAYTEGNIKILVAGPWCSMSAVYTCVFDGKHVAATLLQPGVLRCFTPEHKAGLVTLQVAQDGVIISNSHVFEFRDHDKVCRSNPDPPVAVQLDWFDTNGAQLKQLLLDRLGELERRFISGEKSSSCCSIQNLVVESSEASLLSHVELLMKHQWSTENMYPKAGPNGMTLLHLASALGYAKLISALIRWRSCNSSPALEYEVDAHSVDNQACTPLMWACAKGCIDAALTLYHWNAGALGVCNKDGQLPLALARHRGHHNLAGQVEQLEQAHFKTPAPAPAKIRCQNVETPNTPPAASASDGNSLPQPMSPETIKVEQPDEEGSHGNQEVGQPMQTCTASSSSPLPPLPPPPPGPAKLVRRFSEQVISPSASSSHHPLSKRYSVDVLTSEGKESAATATPPTYHMRDSTSEPRLPLKPDAEFEGSLQEGRPQRVPSLTFVLEGGDKVSVKRKVAGSDRSFLSPLDSGQLPMDTDEASARSDSPFIDVERVSSDEEPEKQDDSKHQMVTLANQIIAAMPERIKLSPSKGDEEDDGCCIRTRSESHSSSAPSQGSPRPSSSSFGDDSGISTPMTDSLAFEEYRYTDFGTPASSLSPDSTCLPSPYSPPYSFALDSPPPTTAEFTEYFNAPATYMEKDFSQLTLSDLEQRKLYEAAKVIQLAYRHYRDKQQQHQKEIEAAVLIQSYYRRYKTYAYYKKMTHAAVLIQNQFRSYSAQKRKKNPGGSTQGSRRELERLKKGRNQSVIIQQRFRSHYQRKSLDGKEGTSAMGVGSGDAPDSSPPSEEAQQLAHELSPPADGDEKPADTAS